MSAGFVLLGLFLAVGNHNNLSLSFPSSGCMDLGGNQEILKFKILFWVYWRNVTLCCKVWGMRCNTNTNTNTDTNTNVTHCMSWGCQAQAGWVLGCNAETSGADGTSYSGGRPARLQSYLDGEDGKDTYNCKQNTWADGCERDEAIAVGARLVVGRVGAGCSSGG